MVILILENEANQLLYMEDMYLVAGGIVGIGIIGNGIVFAPPPPPMWSVMPPPGGAGKGKPGG